MAAIRIGLQIITGVAGIIFMVSCCALDSKSCVPLLAAFISGLWVGGYVFAYTMLNDDNGERGNAFWDR